VGGQINGACKSRPSASWKCSIEKCFATGQFVNILSRAWSDLNKNMTQTGDQTMKLKRLHVQHGFVPRWRFLMLAADF
jgi:hypothetical protein